MREKKDLMRRLAYALLTLALWAGCYAFWLAKPHLMSYQEQYQLFLFTADYFAERIGEIGGMADYLGESVVQFYYVPWIGALGIALVVALLQSLSGAVCLKASREPGLGVAFYALSAVPAIMLWHGLGDENLLMSFAIALVLMQLWLLATLSLAPKGPVPAASWLAGAFASLYWLAGPVAFVYLALAIALWPGMRRRWLWLGCAIVLAFALVWTIWRAAFAQYPLERLLLGLNYYRIPEIYPAAIFQVALAIVVVSLLPLLKWRPKSQAAQWALGAGAAAIAVVFAVAYVPAGYDKGKDELLRYDYLVRLQQWPAIIKMAERRAPVHEFGQQAVNLALAKTGQLADRMFEFPQHGIGSLLGKYERNNTACLVTAEAFYHLGMVNSAFRYNFDLQEAIMNDRKSGRFLKRMAECQIINGNYKVAAKYLNKLQHSLYYSDWAKNAQAFLGDEEKIGRMTEWAHKRRVRFKREMLYDYPEVEKVLGLLAIESEGANPLAWDYFMAALLLKRDLPTMLGIYHYAGEMFGAIEMPRHVQEGVAMFWTMGHPDFAGVPYPISPEVASKVSALAQAVRQNPDSPGAWEAVYPGSYCTYFLRQQLLSAQNEATAPQKGTARGD